MSRPSHLPLQDAPPISDSVTPYDLAHAKIYLRLLDADNEGAPWQEAATVVLGLDCGLEAERAQRMHSTHLERARWMTRQGWKDLLVAEHPR